MSTQASIRIAGVRLTRTADGSIALPRVEMVKLLTESLKSESLPFLTIHFSKKLASYEEAADGVTLRFDDGSFSRAHVLVGAEGLSSPTRKAMYAIISERTAQSDSEKAAAILRSSQPTWTGTYAYRTLLDREKLKAVSPQNAMLGGGLSVSSLTLILVTASLIHHQWCGSGKVCCLICSAYAADPSRQHVISYPISPTVINILFFDTISDSLGKPLMGPPVIAASTEEVVKLYSEWEDDLRITAEVCHQSLLTNAGRLSRCSLIEYRRHVEVGY